tara:strand:+ start:73 stop:693 length:621 start_codon:yes stop_codon:yes gene_type:complete
MITLIDKNNKLYEQKNSINITYPRNVNIIFGNYPYPEYIHQFIIEIKNNLNPELKNYTNVKGGMTDWNYFLDNENFKKFISFVINKHQGTHSDIFEHFFEKFHLKNVWGNEIKKGDSLDYHTHPNLHGVLYLTKGCDLLLPELNLKITPDPGDYYIFPPEIVHGFDECVEEKYRYSLIFNIEQGQGFNYNEKIKNIKEKNNERKNS